MRRSFIIGLVLVAQAGLAQTTTPPPPGPPRAATLPEPVEKTLTNGLRVIVVPKHDLPLVAARVVVKTGSEEDTRELAGRAALTASLLTQGTATRTAEQIARGVEALGATLSATAGWDTSSVDLSVMSPRLEQAMSFVADVVRNPAFRKEDIERVRAQSIDAVRMSLQEPQSIARYVAARVVYQDLPYGQSVAGTPESLERIGREAIVSFHDRYYRPEKSVLILAGDVKPAAAFAMAEKLFGSWKRRKGVEARAPEKPAARAAKPRIVVVDMPEAGQAAVLVTRRGLRRVDPLYYPALVTNSVLGGGYSARLNQEIRIKRGLSYGAGSNFDMRSDEGPFVASTQTKNESAAEVAGLIVDELNRLGANDIAAAELTPRKAVLTGNFGRSLETTGGIVDRVSALAVHGLPLDEIGSYVSKVQAVNSDAVRSFARSRLAGDAVNIVVVGDAKQFLEPLKKRFGEAAVEVIDVEELDLESGALRKAKKAA